ncbi:MAG: tRNA (adenosine(37)-N6)-threonylcarbamoyltransferase complex ATPase subunit type 1 TsaE [Chthoniobacterales bacterium]
MSISNSPEETAAAGAHWARAAKTGDVIALIGDLGAGKTQFVKGFVKEIGSEAEVTSPTFTLVHEYNGGRLPVYHFDFYRLERPEAVAGIGFDDYVDAGGVCLIEWGNRFPELLPAHAIRISFRSQSETGRSITRTDAP